MKKLRKGFTLVELIVVIAIIAILAAVSVAGYFGFINQAKQSTADQEAAQIKNELVAMAAGNGYTTAAGTSASFDGVKACTITLGSDGYLHTSIELSGLDAAKVLAKMYTVSEDTAATDWKPNIVTGLDAATTNPSKELVVSGTYTAGTAITSVVWYSSNGFHANVFKA